MGLIHDLILGLTCHLFGCTSLLCCRKSCDSFLECWPKILFLVFQRPTTIGTDVLDMFGVVALVVVIIMHQS
jgi:hypothetical protein